MGEYHHVEIELPSAIPTRIWRKDVAPLLSEHYFKSETDSDTIVATDTECSHETASKVAEALESLSIPYVMTVRHVDTTADNYVQWWHPDRGRQHYDINDDGDTFVTLDELKKHVEDGTVNAWCQGLVDEQAPTPAQLNQLYRDHLRKRKKCGKSQN